MQKTDQDQPSTLRRALSGGTLLAIGLVMVFIAWHYPVGKLTQMGPGFIPRFIGLLICGLALAIIVIDVNMSDSTRAEQTQWRGLIFISAAIIIFAVLVDSLGLVPSMFLAVLVSTLADDHARPLPILIYTCLVTLGGWLLFLVVLELPIPAFWRWG